MKSEREETETPAQAATREVFDRLLELSQDYTDCPEHGTTFDFSDDSAAVVHIRTGKYEPKVIQ